MTLAYDECGTPGAPSVVFVHGLIASRWIWRQTTDGLADYHCLVPDLPGHGESSGVPWKSVQDTARQVVEMVRSKASGGKAALVGISLGAMIALQALNDAPETVSSVVVSGVNLQPLPRRVRLISLFMMPLLRSERFLQASAVGLGLTEAEIPLYHADLQQISQWTVLRASLAASGFHLPQGLTGRANPALALAGEQENIRVLDSLHTLLNILPNARACKVPGERHAWTSAQPELWLRTLRAWLAEETLPEELIPVKRYSP